MVRCSTCGKESPEGFRFCGFCGAPLHVAPAHEQRKAVTVVFCDVSGSTALGERLDPESLRHVMARYFETARMVMERHGGTVEKFIGDAVMAVFGVPVIHEDDALRALRAAAELGRCLVGLNEELLRDAGTTLAIRVGVNTGEVVTGTAERLVTGDAVNLAARLEQAAEPGTVLLGEETLVQARDAIEVERVGPLPARGKSEPVTAYRLVSVSADAGAVARRFDAPMVGRSRELARLRDAFSQAVANRSCQLFTVLGDAGVGKSRLARAFLDGLDGAGVLRGRCLPYGEGITYWPVVEVITQLLGDEPGRRLSPLNLESTAARAIQGVLGDDDAISTAEEIAWAVRKLLEAAAAESPLVCVLDDLQWGEDTFLDLVEHVADLARGAPILLLCMARPEILDRRPGWAGGKLNATTLLLEPLDEGETDAMIDVLLEGSDIDPGIRSRVRDSAEGNPLFVEQMIALLGETGAGEVPVPSTIRALLAARLDRLDPAERRVLQCGAVEGRVFHRGAVQALAPTEAEVGARLTSLVRKELIRPDGNRIADDEAYRFRHLLIRDAAYDALPKAARAELHELLATWLSRRGTDLVEVDEILGHHLEQAHLCRIQLGPADDRALDLAGRAAERLATAGRRAFARGDMPAATSLLARAAALLQPDDPRRLRLLPSLGRALTETGEWQRADEILSEAADAARAAGERGAAADASVALCFVRLHTDPTSRHEEIRGLLADATDAFESLGDTAGLARVLGLGGMLRTWAGQAGEAIDELDRAAHHAHEAGDRAQEALALAFLLVAILHGPMSVAHALRHTDEIRRRTAGNLRLEVRVTATRASLEAMEGRFDTARSLIAEATRTLAGDLGLDPALTIGMQAGDIELLAGDHAAAERLLSASCEALREKGDWGHYASVAPLLADALLAQDKGEEAVPVMELAARWTLEDDLDAQIGMRRVEAKLRARDGDLHDAVVIARMAVDLAARTDFLVARADTLADLADILRAAGHPDEARSALEEALRLYEQKGNLVRAEQTRRQLADLTPN